MSTQTEMTSHLAAMERVRDQLMAMDAKTLVPTLFKFLFSDNGPKAEVAEIVLVHLGSRFWPLLITHAVVNQQKPQRCLRILGIVEKIGQAPQCIDGMQLISLTMNADAAIRHKAQQILEMWRAAWDRAAGPHVGPSTGCAAWVPGIASW